MLIALSELARNWDKQLPLESATEADAVAEIWIRGMRVHDAGRARTGWQPEVAVEIADPLQRQRTVPRLLVNPTRAEQVVDRR